MLYATNEFVCTAFKKAFCLLLKSESGLHHSDDFRKVSVCCMGLQTAGFYVYLECVKQVVRLHQH